MSDNQKYTKAQRTKERIINSAMRLMKSQGFIATTIRSICRDAGVSVGTFYTYFPTKNDIFSDIFNIADNYFVSSVSEKLKGDNVREKIVDYFRYYARLNIDTGIDTMKVLYNAENVWFAKNNRPMHGVLVGLIEEGQQSGELLKDTSARDTAFFLYTMARGCCYGWCLRNGDYDLEAQLADYISRSLLIYSTDRKAE